MTGYNKTRHADLRDYLSRITPRRFFITIACVLQVFYFTIVPPLQAPDEFNHLYRTYQISEGHFSPEVKENRLGGFMPQGLINFTEQYKQSAFIINHTTTGAEILTSFKIPADADNKQFIDFPNTAYYSPVSYLPQALCTFVLRQFGAPPAIIYYGGRMFVFLTWLLSMLKVLRLLPAFKWLFVGLMLLPMQLYTVNSFSADTVSNFISFLFIAFVLNSAFSAEQLNTRRLTVLVILLCLLVFAKVVYIGLILLLFIIPREKYKNKLQRFFLFTGISGLVLLLLGLWTHTVMSFYIPYKNYNVNYRDITTLSVCGDYDAQKEYISSHPFYFFKVICNSLFRHPATYLSGYIGYFGQSDVFLPGWLYVISYVLIAFVCVNETSSFRLNGAQKTVVFTAALASFVLLLLSQHLMWDCVGEGIVDLVQGRYLIPLFPLLFMMIPYPVLKRKNALGMTLMLFIVFINVYSFFVIYARFFSGPRFDKTEFRCDAETPAENGFLKTTLPTVRLEGAALRTTDEHRSGLHSVRLSTEAAFAFNYKFMNLKKGDLLEVEAWQKGNGAQFVFTGGKKGCGEFYALRSYSAAVEQGWTNIKGVYEINADCDTLPAVFYVWNSIKTTTYVDDLKLTHKTASGEVKN